MCKFWVDGVWCCCAWWRHATQRQWVNRSGEVRVTSRLLWIGARQRDLVDDLVHVHDLLDFDRNLFDAFYLHATPQNDFCKITAIIRSVHQRTCTRQVVCLCVCELNHRYKLCTNGHAIDNLCVCMCQCIESLIIQCHDPRTSIQFQCPLHALFIYTNNVHLNAGRHN